MTEAPRTVEEKRKAFLEEKMAQIRNVQEQGLPLLRLFACCAEEDDQSLSTAYAAFATAQLPRDKAKLEAVWLEFQTQTSYLAWKFVTAWFGLQ